MKGELQQRIIERWPTWFNTTGDIGKTLMPFGFQHGDGWFNLVWQLCERLEPLVAVTEQEGGCSFRVLQVKEKFGGLRFYTTFGNAAISALIETAEAESCHICELCGQPGIRRGASWITTRCDKHA